MVVDMILSQYLLFSMKFGHFIVQNFFESKLSQTGGRDRPQFGLTIHNLDWPSTSGTNCLHLGPTVYIWRTATGCNRDQPSTYKGPQPLIYKSPQPVTYKGCDWLQTKVATGFKQRSQPVTYKGLQLITYGKLWLVLYEKVTFCFSKKWTCLFQIDLTTRILRILPIFY